MRSEEGSEGAIEKGEGGGARGGRGTMRTQHYIISLRFLHNAGFFELFKLLTCEAKISWKISFKNGTFCTSATSVCQLVERVLNPYGLFLKPLE